MSQFSASAYSKPTFFRLRALAQNLPMYCLQMARLASPSRLIMTDDG